LHAPPAFACEGAWVVAGGRCCTHPPRLRARGCRDRGRVVACTPTRLCARGCRGGGRVRINCRMHPPRVCKREGRRGAAGLLHTLHAFASAISSLEAVEAPQQHGRGHVQDQLACTKATDRAGASPEVLMRSPTLEGPAPVGNLLGRKPSRRQECPGLEAREDVATAAKKRRPAILSVPGHQKRGCPLTR
jgi:hypothetical protein